MPLVKVEIIEGKSQEYKSAILDGIHDALVTAFKIPMDDRNQRLYELPKINFEKRKTTSDNFTLIEITAFKGRSYEAKQTLYTEIVKNLSRNPVIKGREILIVINEQPLEKWGMAGGKPADKLDLGFKIDV
jgi:phenylpyruvate tautomerase PptA (4-oxalocrotonate tautomerase family)